MSEENVKNPMDLNGDGKVTLGEKVQYGVGKAQEKVEKAIGDIADDATPADHVLGTAAMGDKVVEALLA